MHRSIFVRCAHAVTTQRQPSISLADSLLRLDRNLSEEIKPSDGSVPERPPWGGDPLTRLKSGGREGKL